MNIVSYNDSVIGITRSIDIIPRNDGTGNIDGSINFMVLSSKILPNLFANGAMHPASQNHPFDVSYQTANKKISNAWLKSISSSYYTDDYLVLIDAQFEAESVQEII